ncbi:RNA dependent RNA polymerase [Aspergillus luchuensis]|uniref:RNA-dependent RNA polymerase n=1 Tax=Aspergillus kawachii TaxID=1069201 RepID=A0A146F0A7_ASPKA|nr:uncharacterized protein AKAW2_11829A [Aspergillus luchuensis]BCR94783.1 hypothetical protein AKAW2_11829A [Aspergillus luchuensis]BCS07365.1 hypothetical protein ALUC_11746A [Aspergillus luchuensis]GAA86189.1 RNA-directed RNA polymerase [Aspergillus luchuensis IFO 4308]GAT19714.1 RNA-directed RNA polymerase [Aspergillus luchuensis]
MTFPRTPVRTGQELNKLIDSINEQFDLDIPNPLLFSPSIGKDDKSLGWSLYGRIRVLYFNRKVDLNRIFNDFEEWIVSQSTVLSAGDGQWGHIPGSFANTSRDIFISNGSSTIAKEERQRYLERLINDELYLLNGSFPAPRKVDELVEEPPAPPENSLKRRLSVEEEFHTAPNSPVKDPDRPQSPISKEDACDLPIGNVTRAGFPAFQPSNVTVPINIFKSPKKTDNDKPSKFVERLRGSDSFQRYDATPTSNDRANFSFSTVADTSSSFLYSTTAPYETSFTSSTTEVDESMLETEPMYEDSVVGHHLSEQTTATNLAEIQSLEQLACQEPRESIEGRIMTGLLQFGPFSHDHQYPSSVTLRYRYELERVAREWGVSLDRMLVGPNISFKTLDDFWRWIEGHSQREGKRLPEKSSRKAWDAATGKFKTDKHSEVVVLTGDLEWSEEGVLKLRLNPLKTERTCRFHRRFGSDRFLSLTVPAPARPPSHLRFPLQPTLLRETLGLWLTQNAHQCLGRTWRPFFVDEVKSKRKADDPKFRIDFFAIDGIDFDHSSPVPLVAPPHQDSSNRTPMSLDALIDWHMPREENLMQTNCKLFQRFSLALSKTYATVVLHPRQVLPLPDVSKPVMNDGCALMSRSLANQICDSLGLTGYTPSAFQGRIAGAKGLWMVDKHRSHVTADDDVWIQISDSQLKIRPHPHEWDGSVDDEKLTFEVVKWSKPLHPVNQTIQLLNILDHGGHIRGHLADLTRLGIQSLYQEFADVLESDSAVLCRSLVQKIRPSGDDGFGRVSQRTWRFENWMSNDAEFIIRLTEAGFCPRSFHFLRKRLGKCLRELLKRHVDELRIEVPLSTYAFCIADPYGVLKEDEVHFGFSNVWRDGKGQFEDILLDGIDVLVGRLPAHLPSDIQRRTAVWKQELRHFKDVIVFPSVGNIPLAHMLSGGDYDGDTPWICWDQNIVRNFYNSGLPDTEFPPEHYGLTKYAVDMKDIQSMDEFLQSSFTFNLTLSNLGRCTVEHEMIAYDEESIDSDKAKELACLLSHLVDGRKAGVHLSEQAWRQYRKKISPRARELPAYKNPRRRPKKSNIIDYLRFEVATQERDKMLTKLEAEFPEEEASFSKDEDLTRPWRTIREKIKNEGQRGQLFAAAKGMRDKIRKLYIQWNTAISRSQDSFSPHALDAAGEARSIPPPEGDHPLILVWQHCRDEWLRVLASYTYNEYPRASFVMHAFGEVLCQIKSSTLPARSVTSEILSCYRVNQKVVAQLTAQDVVEEGEERLDGEDEYEGHEAIEAMHFGMRSSGGYFDPDDCLSVE